MATSQEPKPVRLSQVEMTEIVLPNDANPLGTVLGGKVMHLIDIAASVAAMRHARRRVVTASMDELDFRSPIQVGHIVVLRASVNYVATTSMEVGVKVLSEDPLTGQQRHTSSAYLTFVALDERGRPHAVPPLLVDTADERRRFEEGRLRRERRLQKLGRGRS